jgi:negative regulator of sigma E activity
MRESTSALLDGECSEAELDQFLAEMEKDPALGEQFSRQCLAREARMGTRVRAPDLQFSSRVLAALRDEPAVVVPFGDRARRIPWRAAVSLAAAAAVGAVAVLVAAPQGHVQVGPASGVPVASAPVAVATIPVSAEPQVAELDDEHARQLRNYMLAYNQSRGQQTLGYARYAAYDSATPAAPQTTEAQR